MWVTQKPSLLPPSLKIFETMWYLEDLIVSVHVFREVKESQLSPPSWESTQQVGDVLQTGKV